MRRTLPPTTTRRPRHALPAALVTILLLLAACGAEEEVQEFEDVRTRKAREGEGPREPVSTAERLGFRPRQGAAGNPHAGLGATPRGRFAWETPQGWRESTGDRMRQASWQVEGEPDTDASLILLPGGGGDLLANVNRWRGQMGLEPIDAEALAALPRRPLLGREAVYVDLLGSYTAMGAARPLENARLLGYLLALPFGGVFLKFTGPAAVVQVEEEAFQKLADSLRFPAAGAAAEEPTDGDAPASATAARGGFRWTVPDTWAARPSSSSMRLVTLGPEDDPKTSCAVYLLGGDGGGLKANLDRWRGQVGQAPLTDDELRDLQRIDVLGTQGVLMRAGGDFQGMGAADTENALLYGMVCLLDGRALFVKMLGPKGSMADEWDRFVAFCRSLERSS